MKSTLTSNINKILLEKNPIFLWVVWRELLELFCMSKEEWAHSASDFASHVEKILWTIMVQKGSPPYEEPKNEKEILKGYFKFKVQFTDVT